MTLEEVVKELRRTMPFKPETGIGDIVLVAALEPAPLMVYALVRNIEADTTRKAEWWHVDLHMLTVPPQQVTWTLREPQFSGQEIFTMGGQERFIQAVDLGEVATPAPGGGGRGDERKGRGTRAPFLRVVK